MSRLRSTLVRARGDDNVSIRPVAAALHAAGETVEARRKVGVDHLDAVGLEQAGHARNRINAEVPVLTQLAGLLLRFVETLDPAAAEASERVSGQLELQDILDREIVFQRLGHDRLGPRSVLRGRPRVLAEFHSFQGLNLTTHQEVQGDVEHLCQADQHGRTRHHPASLVLADRLSRHGRRQANGKIPHRQPCLPSTQPEPLSKHVRPSLVRG